MRTLFEGADGQAGTFIDRQSTTFEARDGGLVETKPLTKLCLGQAKSFANSANVDVGFIHSGSKHMHRSIDRQAKICIRALGGPRINDYALCMPTVLAANIRALRNHVGLTQTAFGELVGHGTDQSYVSKWEGGVEPRSLPLAKMADLAGVTVEQFASEPWASTVLVAPDLPLAQSVGHGETVDIIRLDLSLPMGPGATVDDYIEEEPLKFDLAYIRSFTDTPPSRLRLARGVGDSMWPTLHSGDEVWIDSTKRTLNLTDRIWAVSINGGAAIKRLRPLKGGRVLVRSDNPGPGHEDYEVDAEDIILGGRVIKYARGL